MERPLAFLRRPPVLAALLFAVTLALYWPTHAFAFLNYDDDRYVTDNLAVRAGLSAASVRWAFITGYAANWHPLTWLAHMLDVQLFALDAGAHHRTSALLHALNAALLFAALRALTGASGKSALVAALFALHPLRVESVAWVAERKDLLAGACAFGCLWAYADYARRGGAARYALCLGLFALGLLAKPMLVTLPVVLLLLDVWPLRRGLFAKPDAAPHPHTPSLAPTHPGDAPRRPGQRGVGFLLSVEKLPFFALAAASSIVTVVVQRAGGAFDPLATLGFGARLANALHGCGLYVLKTIWPTGLCAFHPHPALLDPGASPWSGAVFAALAFLLGATLALVLLRRRAPFALVGWAWFLGMLVPVSGLVQVGLQGWAERYSYLPAIGLVVAAVWSVEAVARTGFARHAALALALLALGALTLASARQIATWRDSRTLFEHALAVDERNPVAHVNLGRVLLDARDVAGAERHYARALELVPGLADVRVNRAHALRLLGRAEEARAELERALAAEPDLGPAHAELGWLLRGVDDAGAIAHLRRALALEPSDPTLAKRGVRDRTREDIEDNLAWVLATSRTSAAPDEAVALAEQLCRVSHDAQAGFLETLAAALARSGRFDEAVRWQTRALEMVPAEHQERLRGVLELYRAGQPLLEP